MTKKNNTRQNSNFQMSPEEEQQLAGYCGCCNDAQTEVHSFGTCGCCGGDGFPFCSASCATKFAKGRC